MIKRTYSTVKNLVSQPVTEERFSAARQNGTVVAVQPQVLSVRPHPGGEVNEYLIELKFTKLANLPVLLILRSD